MNHRPPAPPPGKKPKTKGRRYLERARAWSRTPTSCGGCNVVRGVAAVVIDAITPKR